MSKRGRLSIEERQYILASVGKKTVEEIAAKLNRNEQTIADFIHENHVPDNPSPVEQETVERAVIRQELRNSEKWKRLKAELSTEEIKFFEEEYLKLMGQFRGDVLPSEETQIFDTIKFDILKSRNMIERRRARDDINRLEVMQEDFLKQFGGDPSKMTQEEKALALTMDNQLQTSRAAEQSRSTEYVKLQERQDALMKSLKSTRDQRVKDIESSKVTFLGLIKMLQRKQEQETEGRDMELMKMATDHEYKRLGQLHTFEDGNADRPILSPETVDMEDE